VNLYKLGESYLNLVLDCLCLQLSELLVLSQLRLNVLWDLDATIERKMMSQHY
jgi:hypothetical protein